MDAFILDGSQQSSMYVYTLLHIHDAKYHQGSKGQNIKIGLEFAQSWELPKDSLRIVLACYYVK